MSIEDTDELPARDDEDSLEELQSKAATSDSLRLDAEDFEDAYDLDLPGAEEVLGHEPEARIILPQKDEFVCSSCYLVHHRSQLRSPADAPPVCSECAD